MQQVGPQVQEYVARYYEETQAPQLEGRGEVELLLAADEPAPAEEPAAASTDGQPAPSPDTNTA